MKVSKILLKQADVPNANGHIYTKECLEKIHTQIQELKGKVLGEFGQSGISNTVDISKAVVVTKDSTLEDDKIYIDVEFIKEGLQLDLLAPALRGMVEDGDMEGNTIHNMKITAIDFCLKEDLE